ncbi:hypothetical protein [Actinoplanes sp. NPDC026619]|uniref:hypothetical protein n=1 Tax=Actinoplanes sp. NPDC026619 TaxID=3155798 RepID=UPI0033FBF162
MGDTEGLLSARDLVPAAGGEWHGLLFDNSAVGLPPALTWTFRVPFEPVAGRAAGLTVEWLPLPAKSWRDLSGLSAGSESFAEPAEASIHHAGHYRYDRVELRVTEQDGPRIRVAVTLGGDIDGLGPAEIAAEAWVTFAGIDVQLGGADSAAGALGRLAEFTDTDGLAEVPDPRGIAFRYAPG